jgi:HD domain
LQGEEAIRVATRLNGWPDRPTQISSYYAVFDEKARFIGGKGYNNRGEPVPEERIQAYRHWRERKKARMTAQRSLVEHPGRLEKAFAEACELHRTQCRKGTTIPYVSHLMSVAALVLENGGDEDEAIAALLHDAAEDQGGKETLERIRQQFGDRVADIVDGCTDTYDKPKPAWKGRKEAYIRHLPVAPRSVRLVAAADKLHNARCVLADYRVIGEELWKRFDDRPREDTLWYHRAVTEALQKAGSNPLVEELDRVVGELERLTSAHSRASL